MATMRVFSSALVLCALLSIAHSADDDAISTTQSDDSETTLADDSWSGVTIRCAVMQDTRWVLVTWFHTIHEGCQGRAADSNDSMSAMSDREIRDIFLLQYAITQSPSTSGEGLSHLSWRTASVTTDLIASSSNNTSRTRGGSTQDNVACTRTQALTGYIPVRSLASTYHPDVAVAYRIGTKPSLETASGELLPGTKWSHVLTTTACQDGNTASGVSNNGAINLWVVNLHKLEHFPTTTWPARGVDGDRYTQPQFIANTASVMEPHSTLSNFVPSYLSSTPLACSLGDCFHPPPTRSQRQPFSTHIIGQWVKMYGLSNSDVAELTSEETKSMYYALKADMGEARVDGKWVVGFGDGLDTLLCMPSPNKAGDISKLVQLYRRMDALVTQSVDDNNCVIPSLNQIKVAPTQVVTVSANATHLLVGLVEDEEHHILMDKSLDRTDSGFTADAILSALYSASTSILKVILAAVSGAFVARYKLTDGTTSMADVSKMVSNVLLPCLIVYNIGIAVTVEVLLQTWAIPFFAALFTFTGLGLGRALACFCEPALAPVVTTAMAFQNVVGLPLAILLSLCSTVDWLKTDASSFDRGTSYVFLYNIAASGLMWSVGYRIIEGYAASVSSDTSVGEEGDDVEGQEGDALIADKFQSDAPAKVVMTHVPFFIRLVHHVWGSLTPPLLAILGGVFIGLTPPLRDVLVEEEGMLRPLFDVGNLLGVAVVPLVLMVLGGNLSNGPKAGGSLSRKTIVLVCLFRLIVMPVIGIVYLVLLDKADVIPDDPVLKLVLLLECCPPTALNMVLICQIHGEGDKEMATLLFWEYIAAVFSMTVMTTISVIILSS